MPVLFRDFECRSPLLLANVGAWRYAAEPSTDVLCVGYAVDDAPVKIWMPGQPIPEEFFAAARESNWLIVAHNDQFETAIEERVLAPRYGWPPIPLERHRCTLAAAAATAIPGALDAAAEAMGIPPRKDAEGYRVMRQMARPRKPHRGEDPGGLYWYDDPERRAKLRAYCQRDVEVPRELFRRLPPLSVNEQALWQLDALINKRGFYVDRELAEAARKIVHEEQAAIDAEVTVVTAGKITSVNQVAKLQAFLLERGLNVTCLTKRSVADVLRHQPAEDVRRLLELRSEGAQAAARKLDSLIAGMDADQRLRGTLRFHGASTGRWSGSRFQPQNLKKAQSTADALEAVLPGDLEHVRQLGAPLAIAGDLSRAVIRAAPGQNLIGADFSAVESRVLAWIAGEQWKLETYRRFDRTGDPTLEPYCVTASKILKRTVTPDDEAGRAIGKTCDLAFGYGGGLGAWRRFDSSDAYTDQQVEQFKADWRASHSATVRFWRALENGLQKALRSGESVILGQLAFDFVDGALRLTLPSGRRLAYPRAHLELDRYAMRIVFKDNARGGWSDVRGWHGTFTENVVQAISRDLLAEALQRLEAANYPVVLHCHDEAVCEVPERFGSAEEFLRLMTELPRWAVGLPLAAKAWIRVRYAKLAPQQSRPGFNTFASAGPPKVSIVMTQHHVAVDECAVPLTELIGRPLIDGKFCCPFHADKTPSLHVYSDHFHCFGCGAHGDQIDWLMLVEGKSRDAAIRALETWQGAEASPVKDDVRAAHTLALALQLWETARPIAGTPVIKYLADLRGIDTDALPDDALRFHRACPFGSGVRLPCLLALYRDVTTDEPAGIHRIALTREVLAGGKVERRSLGSWPTPRAIKFWPATDQLFVGEGIETVLAAATRLEHCGAPMRPAWAAGSSGNVGKLPVLATVRRLILLVDHDESGTRNAEACRLRWRSAGREVVRLRPRRLGDDFNDVVLELRVPT
jgi:DNA polymerase